MTRKGSKCIRFGHKARFDIVFGFGYLKKSYWNIFKQLNKKINNKKLLVIIDPENRPTDQRFRRIKLYLLNKTEINNEIKFTATFCLQLCS